MKDELEKQTTTVKIATFFKNNIMTGILILISAAYIFQGLVNIEKTGQTIGEIIAGCVLSFLVSMSIKILLRKRGIDNGYNSSEFKATQNAYGNQIESISDYVSELDTFCLQENELRLKQKQQLFLTKNAMSMDLLNDEKYNIKPSKNDPNYKKELHRYKCIKKARNMSIYLYTSKLLTNAYDNTANEEELLTASTQAYQSKHTASNIVIGLGCAILFGYFTLGTGKPNWWGMLWSTMQIAMYLILGFIEYLSAYEYVSKTIREKIKRIMVIIDKFNIWHNNRKEEQTNAIK